jgi:hypothetical protein
MSEGASGNGYLTPAMLLSSDERRYAEVTVDGRKALLRTLTRKEMRRLEDSLYHDGKRVKGRYERLGELVLIHSWVDPTTKMPWLTEQDLDGLNQADGCYVTNLSIAALNHTGFQTSYDMQSVEKKDSSSETTSAATT